LPGGEPEQECAYLWPCNIGAWNHWLALQTQWRTGGAGGATGLDYAGVRAYLDECGLQPPERGEVWVGITAAERGMLEGWALKSKQEKSPGA
jgi:hypothetical protein